AGDVGDDVTIALSGGDTIRVHRSGIPVAPHASVQVMVRPEDVLVSKSRVNDPETVALAGEVVEAVYLGDATRILFAVNGSMVAAKLSGRRGADFAPGDAVTVCWPRSSTRILPAASDEATA